MICPFRVNIEWKYAKIEGVEGVVQIEQIESYPLCDEEKCPYYEYEWNKNGSCRRVEDNERE